MAIQDQYKVRSADPEHIPLLGPIERACADIFSEEDLPIQFRESVTKEEIFSESQAQGLLLVVLNVSVVFVLWIFQIDAYLNTSL